METAMSSAELFSTWEKIVSEVWPHGADHKKEDIPAAAVHSKIRGLEHGVLLVEADHPGWIQILQTRQVELLKTVQKRHTELDVRGIAFTLSRVPLSPSIASAEPLTEPPLEEQEDPERRKNCILPKDGELYAAIKNLEESVKERDRL